MRHFCTVVGIGLVITVACSEQGPAPGQSTEAAPFQAGEVVRQVQLAFRPAPEPGAFEATLPRAHVRFERGRLQVLSRSIEPFSVEIETMSIGRNGDAAPATGVYLERDGHLVIPRGSAVEHLRGVEQGIHQSFRFEKPPAGTGALEVRLRMRGVAYTGETRTGHHFTSDAAGLGLTYGAATWIDASGRKTPMAVQVEAGELVLAVDEETLAGSAWPAEIDPIISIRENLIDPVLGYTYLSSVEPDVAFDGTNYLVVWQDNRSIGGHLIGIDATRVSPAGVVLDISGFTVFRSLVNPSIPAVTFDGTNFVVVATDSSGSVRANRVTSSGQVLDGLSGLRVDSTSKSVDVLDVASGGGVSCVVWTDHFPGSGDVHARLFDLAGEPLGTTLDLSPGFLDHVPAVAFNGTDFLVTWRQDSKFGVGPVVGVRVAATGQILDAAPFAIGTADANRTEVSVAAVGSTWLVTWQADTGIVAARVSDASQVLDAPPIALSPVTTARPTATSDGTSFHIAWLTYDAPNHDYDLTVNTVSAEGAPLDDTGVVVVPDIPGATSPSAACSGAACFFTWATRKGYDTFGSRVQGVTPLDATPIHVSASPSVQEWPAVARAGNQYLVVWEDYATGTDSQIYAARVSLTGVVLDPTGIELCSAATDQTRPRVAGTAAGDFFVVWADERAQVTTYIDLYGTQVLADGTVVTPDGARLTTSNDAMSPVIASDGTGYLLAWYESSAPSINNVIEVSRLSPTGALLDSPPLRLTPSGGGSQPTVTFGNGVYLVAYDESGDVRGVRIPAVGAPLDAPPGLLLADGGFPSLTFDGEHWVVAFRRYNPGSPSNRPEYHFYATQIAADGSVLDTEGVQLSVTPVRGYSSSYYRQNPVASFDGIDSVFTWASNYYGGEVFSAWLTTDGEAFGTSTLVSMPGSIPLSAFIAGRGDGDHSLLVYSYGDPTPGVRNFRVGSQVVTFRISGHGCASVAECKSGHCVDGVCCETACGGGSVLDCQACSVAAGGSVDGVCTPLPAGEVCRASTGICDLVDTCDGTSFGCVDAVAGATTVCRAQSGECDREERCTGSSPTCPADSFEPATTICRPASDVCDEAEHCSGSEAACPADAVAVSGTVCRSSAGACDPAETCTGGLAQCPADAFSPPTTTCRASAGPCDVAESCTGSAAACPTDSFQAGGICRATAGPCDVDETCSGTSAACPADTFQTGGICRAAAGPCDVAETCSGSLAACPADTFRTGGICRAAAGPCDVNETCSGSSATCPADALGPAGTVCRVAAGPCDLADSCTGSSAACPADGFQPASVVCRPAAGTCDIAESCSGRAAGCPADEFATQGTTCRASQDVCDAMETCTGASAACPEDAAEPDGTACGSPSCSSTRTCRSGQCVTGPGPDCDDGNPCTTDGCTEGTGCTHEPVAGCCQAATDCDDGNACTVDECLAGGSCQHTPLQNCRPDPEINGGCGCTSASDPPSLLLLVLVLGGAAAARRRRALDKPKRPS
jgi:MYXO-CTERM domain-containing protein